MIMVIDVLKWNGQYPKLIQMLVLWQPLDTKSNDNISGKALS